MWYRESVHVRLCTTWCLTLQQVVQVKASRAVPLDGWTREDRKSDEEVKLEGEEEQRARGGGTEPGGGRGVGTGGTWRRKNRRKGGRGGGQQCVSKLDAISDVRHNKKARGKNQCVHGAAALHELGRLLTQRHSQGCWSDSGQVELSHPERQLEEVLLDHPDAFKAKTKNWGWNKHFVYNLENVMAIESLQVCGNKTRAMWSRFCRNKQSQQ